MAGAMLISPMLFIFPEPCLARFHVAAASHLVISAHED
jgi:hypothetical protein